MKINYLLKDHFEIIKNDLIVLSKNNKVAAHEHEKEKELFLVTIINQILTEDLGQQKEAIAQLKKLALDNKNSLSGDANVILGSCYEFGLDIEEFTDTEKKDSEKAKEAYKFAAERNSPMGLSYYGDIYYYGNFNETVDKTKATSFYDRTKSMEFSGFYFRMGREEEAKENQENAIVFYRLAMEKGSIIAAFYLARIYEKSKSEDLRKQSINLYLGASKYLIRAQFRLGQIYTSFVIQKMPSKKLSDTRREVNIDFLDSNNLHNMEQSLQWNLKAGYAGHPIVIQALFEKLYSPILLIKTMPELIKLFAFVINHFKQGNVKAGETLCFHIDLFIEKLYELHNSDPSACQSIKIVSEFPNSSIFKVEFADAIVDRKSEQDTLCKSKPVIDVLVYSLLRNAGELGLFSISLARCYQYGIGVDDDSDKAREIYRSIAESRSTLEKKFIAAWEANILQFRVLEEELLKSKQANEAYQLIHSSMKEACFQSIISQAEKIEKGAPYLFARNRLYNKGEIFKNLKQVFDMGSAYLLSAYPRISTSFKVFLGANEQLVEKTNELKLLMLQLKVKLSENENWRWHTNFPYFAAYMLAYLCKNDADLANTYANQVENMSSQADSGCSDDFVATAADKKEDHDQKIVTEATVVKATHACIPYPELFFNFIRIASELESPPYQQSNGDAQYFLGNCYETGTGVEFNLLIALNYYQTSIRIKRNRNFNPTFPIEEVPQSIVIARESNLRSIYESGYLPLYVTLFAFFDSISSRFININTDMGKQIVRWITDWAFQFPDDLATPEQNVLNQYLEQEQKAGKLKPQATSQSSSGSSPKPVTFSFNASSAATSSTSSATGTPSPGAARHPLH